MHRRPASKALRAGRGALLLAVALSLGACSTYADRSAQLRQAALTGDRHAALNILQKDEDDAEQLTLLQRGLLHFEMGEDSLAVADFAAAERVLDENFTKSISHEALAFLTNDATRAYIPYPSEQVLLNFYAGLSYLGLGDRQGALVEFRKAAQRLQTLEDLRKDAEGYRDDPFVEWISALLFSDDRDANATMVSFRRALAAFQDEDRIWPHPVPPEFLTDYADAAIRFGFPQEAEEVLADHPDLRTQPLRSDEGELVLVFGSGFVDHLEENRADYPILESDDAKGDDDYARTVFRRGRRGRYVPHDDVKIAYWLSVAVPVLASTGENVCGARLVVGDQVAESRLVSDLSAAFDLTFTEGEGRRMLRTLVRAITKYLTVRAVKKGKNGEEHQVAGFLANLVSSATERADTRSWTLLPDRLQVARLRLPAGTHSVQVEFVDRTRRVTRNVDLGPVRVAPGRHTFLYQRAYR